MSLTDLFNKELQVINTGLISFNENLEKTGTQVIQVDWKPPVNINEKIIKKIKNNLPEIEKANQKTLKIILNGKPVLIGLEKAIEVIPAMKKNLIYMQARL